MCKTTPLQHKIQKRTGNGDLIANFLADTIEGKYPYAKYHHKLEAAKLLARYGETGNDPNRHSCESRNPAGQGEGHGESNSQFWGLIPTPEELAAAKNTPSPSTGEGWDGGEKDKNPHNPVSYADILNYDIAHLIRQETAEGHTIAEFLSHVMTRRDQPFTPKKLRIRHVDRMAAAREILRRGHGHFGRRRKLVVDANDDNNHDDTNDYDTLHTDLAKRMREYNEHGTDAIRFLLDVMSDTSLDPEEGYTWHHKMSAAHEIIRRGWDTNYDKITPEMLQAYWQDQQSTRLSIGQKKQLAGLPTFLDEYDHYDNEDYQAIADAIRDQEDLEDAAATTSLPPRRGKARMGVTAPNLSQSQNNETTTDRHSAAPGKSPLSPGERVRVRGNAPASSPPQNNAATPTRHSCESRNPAGQGAGTETTNPFVLSPVLSQSKGLSKDEPASSPDNTEDNASSPSCTSMSVLPDDLDCYYEPLTPEDQAIFNYNSLIESGEFEESEITFVPPSEAAHHDYAITLKQLEEAAESEGIPLLPNPLAGTLIMPAIRSP